MAFFKNMICGFGKGDAALPAMQVSDDEIVAIADGELVDVSSVSDPVFANKLMGDSVAFHFEGSSITICSPANGVLSVLFPTGHAFGITRKDGVEILVHIGINTVNTKGDGFKIASYKQGDSVKAGNPIVTVNLKKLRKMYDMSTMLVITKANDKNICFIQPQHVIKGQSIIF